MFPHKIKSAFKAGKGGRLISPPGTWTPPNQEVADRLIAAGCLRKPKDRPDPPEPEATPEPEADPAGQSEPDPKPKKGRGRRK
jgi:hypothetical protein